MRSGRRHWRSHPGSCLWFLTLAAVGVAGSAAAVGCDKGQGSPAAPAKDGVAPGGKASGAGTGVVSFEQVFRDLGWYNNINRDLEAVQQDARLRLESFGRELNDVLAQKRQEIAAAQRLTPQQTEDLNNNRNLDKLPLTPEQQQELLRVLNSIPNLDQQARTAANRVLQERQNQLVATYRDAAKPSVRRVAEANGMTAVLPLETMAYYADTINLTNRVIDDLRQNPPVIKVPDAPKVNLPRAWTLFGPAGTQPTTLPTSQPAVGPAMPGPTTPATPAAPGVWAPAAPPGTRPPASQPALPRPPR